MPGMVAQLEALPEQARLADAAGLVDRLVLDDDFAEFLTLRVLDSRVSSDPADVMNALSAYQAELNRRVPGFDGLVEH